MASEDIYVRKDVYEAGQRAIIAEIQRGNAEILRVIERNNSELNLKLEQYRNETKVALEKLRSELSSKLEQYQNESKAELEKFKREVNSRFDKLEAQLVVLSGRVDALELRMGGLERRIDVQENSINRVDVHLGTGIAFIAMLIGLVVFLMPISRFMRRFWRPKPTITLEQIEALIDAKLSAKQ